MTQVSLAEGKKVHAKEVKKANKQACIETCTQANICTHAHKQICIHAHKQIYIHAPNSNNRPCAQCVQAFPAANASKNNLFCLISIYYNRILAWLHLRCRVREHVCLRQTPAAQENLRPRLAFRYRPVPAKKLDRRVQCASTK